MHELLLLLVYSHELLTLYFPVLLFPIHDYFFVIVMVIHSFQINIHSYISFLLHLYIPYAQTYLNLGLIYLSSSVYFPHEYTSILLIELYAHTLLNLPNNHTHYVLLFAFAPPLLLYYSTLALGIANSEMSSNIYLLHRYPYISSMIH